MNTHIFGLGGSYDPIVLNRLNEGTRDFWFSRTEQAALGMHPGTPSAAHMCTAETFFSGCRMGMEAHV